MADDPAADGGVSHAAAGAAEGWAGGAPSWVGSAGRGDVGAGGAAMNGPVVYLFEDRTLCVVVITRDGNVVGERKLRWNGDGFDTIVVPDADAVGDE